MKKGIPLIAVITLIISLLSFDTTIVKTMEKDISNIVTTDGAKLEVFKHDTWVTIYENGAWVAGAPNIKEGESVKFTVDWHIDDLLGNQVSEGDFFKLNLPDNLFQYAAASNLDILSSDGTRIATFDVDPNTKEVIVRLTDAIEGKAKIDGSITALGTAETVTNGKESITIGGEVIDIEIEAPDIEWNNLGGIAKQGWQVGTENSILWEIHVNQEAYKSILEGGSANTMQNPVLIDHLEPGLRVSSLDISLPLMIMNDAGNLTWVHFSNEQITNQFFELTQVSGEDFDTFVDRVKAYSTPAYGIYNNLDGSQSVVVSFKDLPSTQLTNIPFSTIQAKLDTFIGENPQYFTGNERALTLDAMQRLYNYASTGAMMPRVHLLTRVDGNADEVLNTAILQQDSAGDIESSTKTTFTDYNGSANVSDSQSLIIQKYEKNTTNAIENAQFKLQKMDGLNFVDYIPSDGAQIRSTDSDGKITFKNLPYGVYKVVEVTPAIGYTPDIWFKDDIDTFVIDGTQVEATLITAYNERQMTQICGQKIWDDNENAQGLRPDSITIELYGDDILIDTKEVSANTDWKYCFENLPMYNGTQLITYRIDEVHVNGYETIIDGFNITNKLIPTNPPINPEPPKPEEPTAPSTGVPHKGLYEAIALSCAFLVIVATLLKRQKNNG